MKTQDELKEVFFELVDDFAPKYKDHFRSIYNDFCFDGTETNAQLLVYIRDEVSECASEEAEHLSIKKHGGNDY